MKERQQRGTEGLPAPADTRITEAKVAVAEGFIGGAEAGSQQLPRSSGNGRAATRIIVL